VTNTIDTGIDIAVETITPLLAAEYMAKNTRNRHINWRTVAKYAHDIENGNWQMAGEPIKFGSDGSLLDGQHRLEAILKTQQAVQMVVVRGLAPESQHVMDSGKPRGFAGQLQIAGHPNASRLAATARLAYWHHHGILFNDSRIKEEVSISDLIAFVDFNPDLATAITLLPSNYRQKIDASPQVICTFIWITRRRDSEASERFMDQLITKANLPNGSPILALDSRFREMSRLKTHVSRSVALSAFIRAWNAWRQDKPLGRIQTHREGTVIQFKEVV
jgi:hypothetical protein